ncbi:alkylphosphonate utilization protein [Pseudomaricurvus sp. HS19]|uniref:PhnA domain-containing protein n=1 Tax=Pseudomaricurvus sp. HS19 TaxID=2692626 RepID=UPI001367AFB6|nr:alkylphosphonate utilization protein [Pseudomaricurvus sp. HS19]MYM62542.1 hypothetical protein [Pseudomaricurvus sp. HS19]
MSIDTSLQTRANNQCELCGAGGPLAAFAVEPSDGSVDQAVAVCDSCLSELGAEVISNPNYWRCLNDSMWSQVPAVQVVAWRMLGKLARQGEAWAQDLQDMLYLDDDNRQWAEALEREAANAPEPTRDSNGAILEAGDTVTIIKDLDVKGTSMTAKRGTAVRGISLTSNPEHIEGRVNGQRIVILSCYVKKS